MAIDHDSGHIRDVARSGACDFVVNTLDEAIRAMKNEIRKGAPLSVALSADPGLVLNEILERGLAPQLFTSFLPRNEHIVEAADRLRALGGTLVDFHSDRPPANFQSSKSFLAPVLQNQRWSLHTFTFDSLAALRAFDAKAVSLLQEHDTLRSRWLHAAPKILRRQHPPARSLWLTPDEFQTLKMEVSSQSPQKSIIV